MQKREWPAWLTVVLWLIGGIIFVIMTAEIRDLILFVMLGILLYRTQNKLF